MKLEIVTDFDRLQRRIDTLQQRFNGLKIIARSSFFVILGCSIPQLSAEDKLWLEDMVEAQVIHRFRCKEREDR